MGMFIACACLYELYKSHNDITIIVVCHIQMHYFALLTQIFFTMRFTDVIFKIVFVDVNLSCHIFFMCVFSKMFFLRFIGKNYNFITG